MVSIIVPVYNRSAIVIKTIDSILSQTYVDWECIIVDDHSTDDSVEVIGSYIENRSNIQLVKNTRKKGAQGARNTGLLLAKGDFVTFFDSDNLMRSNFLEEMVSGLASTDINVVSCFSTCINDQGEEVGTIEWKNEGDISEDILNAKAYVDYNSALIQRAQLLAIGSLDEDCPSFQEWDTHIRLSRKAKYATIRKHLIVYRKEGSDSISKSKKRAVHGYFYILKKHKHLFESNGRAWIDRNYTLVQRIMSTSDFSFQLGYFAKAIVLAPINIWLITKVCGRLLIGIKSK